MRPKSKGILFLALNIPTYSFTDILSSFHYNTFETDLIEIDPLLLLMDIKPSKFESGIVVTLANVKNIIDVWTDTRIISFKD